MAFMHWSKEFELGVPEMDKQHQKWLEILNNFYDHISKYGDFNEEMKTLLNEAYDYTNYHFTEEERLMEELGYPALSEQKMMHNEIKEKIKSFKTKLEKGEHLLSISLTNELKSWFKNHILIEDKKYADRYINR